MKIIITFSIIGVLFVSSEAERDKINSSINEGYLDENSTGLSNSNETVQSILKPRVLEVHPTATYGAKSPAISRMKIKIRHLKDKGFKLTCEANGEKLSYQWTALRGDLLNNEVAEGNVLSINSRVTNENYRTFCCKAFNTAWSHKKCTKLPSITRFSEKSTSQAVGSSTELLCEVDAKDASKYHIKWKRANGLPLPKNAIVDGDRVRIHKLAKRDAGIYICVGPSNNGTEVLYSKVSLKIISPPKIVNMLITGLDGEYDNNITIECVTQRDETIAYKWKAYAVEGRRRLRENEKADRNFLSIYNFKEDNEGTFCCVTTNALGRRQKCVTIKVPVVKVRPEESIAKLGDKVYLICEANHRRQSSVYWRKFSNQTNSYQMLQSAAMHFAIPEIRSLSENKARLYQCLDETSVGFGSLQRI